MVHLLTTPRRDLSFISTEQTLKKLNLSQVNSGATNNKPFMRNNGAVKCEIGRKSGMSFFLIKIVENSCFVSIDHKFIPLPWT